MQKKIIAKLKRLIGDYNDRYDRIEVIDKEHNEVAGEQWCASTYILSLGGIMRPPLQKSSESTRPRKRSETNCMPCAF
jgi:hypothetical protein